MTGQAFSGILVSMATRKSPQKATIGSVIANIQLQTLGLVLIVALLLVSFLVIGYLLGKVESLQKGTAGQPVAGAQAPGTTDPGAPAAPDPEQVKKDLKMGGLPVQGNENAKVTIVEFSDFECPFCGKFYTDAYPQLKKDYIDTGKVKLYYRHYPLPFHPKAVPLALASECANDQGAFWRMHDKIFDNNATVASATDEQIKQYGADLGLDVAAFNNCYDNKTHQAKVDEDTAAGSAVGVSGTPTFYINGRQLVGAQPYASFQAIIDEELSK